MTGHEFRQLRLKAALSTRVAAREVGVAHSNLTYWERRDSQVPDGPAETIRRLAGETPDPKTIAYALGRVLACCAEVWEARPGGVLPLDLYDGYTARPGEYLGQLISRTRAHNPERYASVEDEITEHLAQVPADALADPLGSEPLGQLLLGYYHRAAERRAAILPDPDPDRAN